IAPLPVQITDADQSTSANAVRQPSSISMNSAESGVRVITMTAKQKVIESRRVTALRQAALILWDSEN
ncbi:hypothetical protein JTM52_35510, partial [Pseudomonas aeruginosa]|nr:hypothetical protein [Pseudomonas aeruginosa]